jgi:hypothetical protein
VLGWFTYLRDRVDPKNDNKDFVQTNLYAETQCFRDWIADYNPAPTTPKRKLFDRKSYLQKLINDNPNMGVDVDTLTTWITDERYHFMLDVSGVQDYLEDIPKSVIDEFRSKTKHLFSIDWDSAKIIVTVQQPGTVFPLHYDLNKNARFGIDNAGYGTDLELDPLISRWLIMLDDQQPGQCFYMNNHNIQWRAGDVLGWDHLRYHHGGANFGFWPRYNINLTGRTIK